MEKTFKVITETEFGEIFIEIFKELKTANEVYKKSIKEECKICYLLETEIDYEISGSSCNKILSTYKK